MSDLISRQAAIDEAFEVDTKEYGRIDVVGVDAIEALPPVTPQPKTGYWINLGVQGEIDGQIVKGFTCSKCGAISVFRMTGRKIINGDLCPGCGAKMLEGVRT